jgi:hypothetical protein
MNDMEDETTEPCKNGWQQSMCNWKWKNHMHSHGCGGAIYVLGFLGALYYYWTTSASVWAGFIGLLKAIFWPAFLVYGLFKFLGL